MLVGDAVEERHQDVEARIQRAAVLAETLDDVRGLLRDDDGGLEDRHEDDERHDAKKYESRTHQLISFTLNVRLFCEMTWTSAPAAIAPSAVAVHCASPISTRPSFGGLIASVTLPRRPM